MENTNPARIEELVLKQRAFFASGTTRDLAWRKKQLKSFNAGLKKWETPLCDALWADLHKSYEEAFMTEIGLVYGEIGEAIHNLHSPSASFRALYALIPARLFSRYSASSA